jgi:outer membrane protein OmpA-like peptidoglycan-associated protein
MRSAVVAGAAALALLPFTAHAQLFSSSGQSFPGFYVGAQGGLNWLLESGNSSFNTGWTVGGVVGYDFVGPRVELEGMYRSNNGSQRLFGSGWRNYGSIDQVSVMANVLYDFTPGATITPYIGAGAGIAFVDPAVISSCSLCSTQFAYQAMLGVGYNVNENFRINLEGRYYGTTSTNTYNNNNIGVLLGVSYKFGGPTVAPPPPPAPAAPQTPSFMVFFDWDRADITPQALGTIRQAVQAFNTRGNARITATGHTDKSGPESYNMALSLRRANAVKDALVREGVPATAIAVVGRGEAQPLVPTADGVREPQNRRVEIVVQ